MFHHARSKSAPCYNMDNIMNQQQQKQSSYQPNFASSSTSIAFQPHTPHSTLNWQFGDAPASSPRRDSSCNDSLPVANRPETFALDNQFFAGGVLDWDVSIDTISTAIEETKRGKHPLQDHQQPAIDRINVSIDQDIVKMFGDALINSNNEEEDIDDGIMNNDHHENDAVYNHQRFVGSTASFGYVNGQEEHRRCASFTCFPNISDFALSESNMDDNNNTNIPPLKKKRFFQSPISNTETISTCDSPSLQTLTSSSSMSNIDTFTSNAANANGLKKKKARSLVRSSGFRGVSRCSKDGRWQARIRIGETVRYLGRFMTQEEAALCYDNAARIHHGPKAILNFKGPGDEHLTQSKKLSRVSAAMDRTDHFDAF